jgi:hypothetical protein
METEAWSEEIRIPVFTEAELKRFVSRPLNDPELLAWMDQNQIVFDNGPLDIMLDGKPRKMQTSRGDFGTIIE